MMTATRTSERVTLVTGDSLPITLTFDGGAIRCPWCWTSWAAADETCPNPACVASKWADEAYVHETLAARAAEQTERDARERSRQLDAQDHKRRQADAAERYAAVMAEADRHGACRTCASRTLRKGQEPRYVKHRRADFHEAKS